MRHSDGVVICAIAVIEFMDGDTLNYMCKTREALIACLIDTCGDAGNLRVNNNPRLTMSCHQHPCAFSYPHLLLPTYLSSASPRVPVGFHGGGGGCGGRNVDQVLARLEETDQSFLFVSQPATGTAGETCPYHLFTALTHALLPGY